jgi:hypothetical protein
VSVPVVVKRKVGVLGRSGPFREAIVYNVAGFQCFAIVRAVQEADEWLRLATHNTAVALLMVSGHSGIVNGRWTAAVGYECCRNSGDCFVSAACRRVSV